MPHSPGHKQAPDHKITEKAAEPIQIASGGVVLAASDAAILVEEDNHPPRHYLPRSDVNMAKLQRSEKTSYCPFKGTATYFHVAIGEKTFENVAWSYEEPYEEHAGLKSLIAFYDEHPEIYISRKKKTVP